MDGSEAWSKQSNIVETCANIKGLRGKLSVMWQHGRQFSRSNLGEGLSHGACSQGVLIGFISVKVHSHPLIIQVCQKIYGCHRHQPPSLINLITANFLMVLSKSFTSLLAPDLCESTVRLRSGPRRPHSLSTGRTQLQMWRHPSDYQQRWPQLVAGQEGRRPVKWHCRINPVSRVTRMVRNTFIHSILFPPPEICLVP